MVKNVEYLLSSLGRSKFRGSFHLNNKMKEYVISSGLDKIEKDAYEIISKRIKPAVIPNDGKQTPMKQVHPVFIGQHATGTCCRGCLNRIHNIDKNRELSDEEVSYIVNVIMTWIRKELN